MNQPILHPEEIIKPLIYKGIDYTGLYGVTNHGRVYSYPKQWTGGDGAKISHNGKWLKNGTTPKGYLFIRATKNKICGHVYIAIAIAETFIDNYDYEYLIYVNHKDGDKQNNYHDNLEWVTASQNSQHAWDNYLCKRARAVYNDKGEFYKSAGKQSKLMGFNRHAIANSIKSKAPCGGYYWHYA